MNGDESPYVVDTNGTTVLRPSSVAAWLTIGALAVGFSLMVYGVIESGSAWFLLLVVPFAAFLALEFYPLLIAHRLGLFLSPKGLRLRTAWQDEFHAWDDIGTFHVVRGFRGQSFVSFAVADATHAQSDPLRPDFGGAANRAIFNSYGLERERLAEMLNHWRSTRRTRP